MPAYAAGQRHLFRLKTLGPVLWRKSGAKLPLRVIVIAPLGYRLRQGGKLLYRQPAYLICTEAAMPLAAILQYYLWRWGIEVNFREEKSLLGAGEAQVRTAGSNRHLPAVMVAAYAMLWLAALEIHQEGGQSHALRPPRWRRKKEPDQLPSTGDLIRTLRYEYWASALRPGNFDDFVNDPPNDIKPPKLAPSLAASIFLAA